MSAPGRAGAFSRDLSTILALESRAFSGALKIEKLKAPLIPSPKGAVDTNDWCIKHQIKQKQNHSTQYTVMIQSFRTDRSGQTVQTQIRALLKERSDQGLHRLLFHLHLFDKIPQGLASFFNLR